MYTHQNITPPSTFTYRQDILAPLTNILSYYVNEHSKAMAVRFDLHYPKDYPVVLHNEHISTTIAYVIKRYKRHGLDPMYFWVREQHNSVHPHYHGVLFLDAQKVRSYGHVFHTIQEAWGRALGVDVSGCVHHCNVTNGAIDMHRNGLQIRRCDGPNAMQEQVQAAYNQVSYLAKVDTKAPDNDGQRNFGMSRIPKR